MTRALRPSRHRSWCVLLALLLAAVCLVACAERAADEATDPSGTPGETPALRVVSLVPALTETVLALGAGDTLVGIGRFDPAVPGRPDVPRLGDAFDVGLEPLAALAPDVVLVNAAAVSARLEPLAGRLHVVAVETDSLEQTYAAITTIGAELDRAERARELVNGLRRAVADAAARRDARSAAGDARPRVLVVLQHGPLYVAGAGSFVHELLGVVGARNVAGDLTEPWPTLNQEALVARAPDVVLDASAGVETGVGDATILARWERFATVPAVATGRVLVVRSEALFRPGPRIGEALADLEGLLFPETSDR